MKSLRYFILIFLCGVMFSCKKSETTPSSAMSASINGGSTITFSPTFTNSNGVMVLQGTSNTYSIQIYIQITGPGIQYFQSAPNYPYATVTDITGSYSTNAVNMNEISISAGNSSGLYNGTFNFIATGSAGTINVLGQFNNM